MNIFETFAKIGTIVILLILIMLGCQRKDEAVKEVTKENSASGERLVHKSFNLSYGALRNSVSIIKIDSCEYIYVQTTQGVAIVHKANCENTLAHVK